MKHVIRELVGELLRCEKRIKARELVARSGLSRQVVHRHLRRLVLSGELLMHGETRGVTYSAGPAWPKRNPLPVPFGSKKFEPWSLLKELCPRFEYVELAPFGPFLRTREQGRQVFAPIGLVSFVVLDFRGITRISEACAEELLGHGATSFPCERQHINAIPSVEAVIERMLLLFELRLKTPR